MFTGTVDEVSGFFTEMRWSDGLPITPPTVDRVEEFLEFTDLDRDETVAVLPIAHRDTKVWHVAVNGVMAGCPPEYMPLLIAYTQALADPHQRRYLGSTHSWVTATRSGDTSDESYELRMASSPKRRRGFSASPAWRKSTPCL